MGVKRLSKNNSDVLQKRLTDLIKIHRNYQEKKSSFVLNNGGSVHRKSTIVPGAMYNLPLPFPFYASHQILLTRREGQDEGEVVVPDETGERPSVRVPSKHIIPADAIVINKELGVGEFGVVQQGVWTNEEGERVSKGRRGKK